MKTMSDYTLYCNTIQTRKALELGAPIENIQHYASIGKHYTSGNNIYNDGICYFIPTAEQMIGWLEEKGISFDTEWSWNKQLTIWVWDHPNRGHISTLYSHSRKEASLAAIDAALEYLENNKNVNQ